jgi:hypothetical protein
MTYRAQCQGRRSARGHSLARIERKAFEPGPLGWSITITEAGVALDVPLPKGMKIEVSLDSGRHLSPVSLMTTTGPYACEVAMTFTPTGARWLEELIEEEARLWAHRMWLLELLRARTTQTSSAP